MLVERVGNRAAVRDEEVERRAILQRFIKAREATAMERQVEVL